MIFSFVAHLWESRGSDPESGTVSLGFRALSTLPPGHDTVLSIVRGLSPRLEPSPLRAEIRERVLSDAAGISCGATGRVPCVAGVLLG